MTGLATRVAVADLVSARPMLTLLPAIFQEDEFASRWLEAFDVVTSPIDVSLDCFASYLDPSIAPEDFLIWVGSWLGSEPDEDLPLDRRRSLVGRLVDIYGRRGTADSICELIELQLPASCEVIEGGGAQASGTPGTPLPGRAVGVFVVRVTASEGVLSDHQRRRARLIVDATRPAHLPAVVEFPDAEPSQVLPPEDPAPASSTPTQTRALRAEPTEKSSNTETSSIHDPPITDTPITDPENPERQ